jgi:hypothetical protein
MSWAECLISPAACAVQDGKDALADSAWDSFLRWMARGLNEITPYVFQAFSISTTPQFDQAWWRDNLDLMIAISLPLLAAGFIFQCVSAAIRREPGRLGHAVLGVLLGTAGVPLAVAIVASCGAAVDGISAGILGNTAATTNGLKRMLDITSMLSVPTFGGSLITAVTLALLATMSLYFVMLIREVAIVAFVVFAPIALASWTWSATRHWLRRWIEVVGALVFSKIAMAVIFTLGLAATGNIDQQGDTSIGTFLTGILLFAMASFAPLATYSFIHWAGDQGHAMAHALQQGTAGTSAVKERFDQAQQWGAQHFGGLTGGGSDTVGGGSDESIPEQTTADPADAGTSPDSDAPIGSGGGGADSSPAAGSGEVSTAIAVATSQVSVDGSSGPGEQGDSSSNGDSQGGERQ